jgi:hypothetical protein
LKRIGGLSNTVNGYHKSELIAALPLFLKFETLGPEKGILVAEEHAGRCFPIAGFEGLDSIGSFKNQPILRDLGRPDAG